MKKILFLISFLFMLITTTNYTYAGVINSSISLSGITIGDTTGKSNAGNIVFPKQSGMTGVTVNASGLTANPSGDITITGNFFLGSTYSSSSGSLGWATFDIGTSCTNTGGSAVLCPSAVKLINNGGSTNKFTFSGATWSNAAGWILFSKDGFKDSSNSLITDSQVVYDRNNNKVSGCARSENLGWICINDFTLDTTPINLTSNFLKNRDANHKEQINLSPENVSKIEITTYTGSTKTYLDNNNINHDMRKAGEYNIKVYDENDSYSTGVIIVVAGEPVLISDFLPSYAITGGQSSTFTNTANNPQVANNTDTHNIDFKLRDKYGNPVISETGIKTVKVTLSFSNNVHKDQLSNPNTGDAITYSNYTGLNKSGNTFSGATTDGNYKIDIKSLAPTSSGYTLTTPNNNINISSLNVEVKAEGGNTGVGERNGVLFSGIGDNLKFTPAVKVSNLENSDSFKLLRDVPSTFTGTITLDKPKNVSNINITHILNTTDTTNSSILKDNDIRFKVSTSISNGTTNGSSDTSTGTSIKNKYTGTYNSSLTQKDTFSVTPKIVNPGVTNFGVKYTSNVSYNVLLDTISYPTYSYIPGGKSLVNNQLKVAGLVNNASTQTNSKVVIDDKTSYIGKVDKPTVIANIKKNIVKYQKVGKGTDGVLYINNTNYTISASDLATYNTIIVDGGDLTISNDITNTSKLKAIIALKGNSTNKGNIWITSNVQKIYATLVTDRSVLSGDGTSSYNTNVAQDQLFIKGSVLSYNTIGGSSSATPKCPFYVTTTCTQSEALKYDFNNFRYYIKSDPSIAGSGQGTAVSGISSNYDNSPMIVEYDSTLQTNPPKVFLNN